MSAIEPGAACDCGHQLGHHEASNPPAPCRVCNCRAFHQGQKNGSVILVAGTPWKPSWAAVDRA